MLFRSESLLHFADHAQIVGLQDPGVAQGVAIVEHFLEVGAAEACLVRKLPDVGLHVGGTAAQHKVQKILFNITLNIAEGAFVTGIYGIV